MDDANPGTATPRDEHRASDADRQRVAEQLREALDEGRLTLLGYDERLGSAYRAKTYGELAAVTRDLPTTGSSTVAAAAPTGDDPTARPRWTRKGYLAQQGGGWLAGDADRQRVADQLLGALDEGRLTLMEYDERLLAAYGAKTYGELAVITRDLPPPPTGTPPAPVDHADPSPPDRPDDTPPGGRSAELLPFDRPDDDRPADVQPVDVQPVDPAAAVRPFDRPAGAFSYGPPASTWTYGPPHTWPVDPPTTRPSTPPAPVRPTPQPPSLHPTRDYLARKGRSWLSGALVTNVLWAATSGFEFHQFYWPGGILVVWAALVLGKAIRGKQFNPDTDERELARVERLAHELRLREQRRADIDAIGTPTPPRTDHPPR